MFKVIELDKKKYKVRQNEFSIIPHELYNNLTILADVGTNDRVVSLIKDFAK